MSQRKVSRRASMVWKRLAQTYGARLQDQYGPTCPPDWCEIIDRSSDEQIDKAILVIRREHLQYPPTLGQFEAAIPRRKFGKEEDSIPDRLICHALRTLPLCEHQSWRPWTFFGKQFDDGTHLGGIETTGVVIPPCGAEGCPNYGRPNHRLLARDLPPQ